MRNNDFNGVIMVMMLMWMIGVGDRVSDGVMMMSVIVLVMVSVMMMVSVLVIDNDCVDANGNIHCVDITGW